MKPCIVCRYSEIALKGKNRYIFEDRLVKNLAECLKRNNISGEIQKLRGRVIIYADHKATSFVKRVFGLVSISPAYEVEAIPKIIKSFVADHAKTIITKDIQTFRISTNRQDKRFPISSMDFDRDIGAEIADTHNLKVKLNNPDLNLEIDISNNAYIFHKRIQCLGGLPVSVSGSVVCIINKPEDLTSAYLMLKRGCSTIIKSESDIDCSILSNYDYGSPFIQSDEPLERIIPQYDCQAVVVSWLLEDFSDECNKDFKVSVPILTPLVGYSKEEAEEFFKRIQDV